jgi:RNA polymerase sigma-70 factor, ECF subfamily
MGESRASSIEPGTEGEFWSAASASSHAAGVRVERLYEDYSGLVYRYCLSRLDSPEEAEDALQATYLNAWRSLSSGVEPISTRPWLFQIAANVCSSTLRTRLGRAKVELRSPEDFDRMPAEAAASDDLLGLSAALEQLPERQRHALLLRDWRGLSYDEIAAEMNSSYQAVETLLFRARRSVAAGLRTPEPAKVPVPARALAPLPFLLPLKDGLASFKSAFSASIAPIKVSLGIALGAAAPLVAYGILESSVADPPAAQQAAAPPAVQAETPLTFVAPLTDRQKTSENTKGPAQTEHPKSHSGSSSHDAGVSGGETASSHEDPSGVASDPSSPTTEPGPPPTQQEDEPSPSLVTICHHTKSKKNPTVTIAVAAEAVDALLAQGDALGACAS